MNNEAIYSHVTVLNNGMHDSCVYQSSQYNSNWCTRHTSYHFIIRIFRKYPTMILINKFFWMNRCDAVFFCFFVLFLLWIDRTAYDGIDMTLKKPLLIELFLFYFQVPSWPSRRWRAFLSRNDYLAFVNQKPEIISSKRIKVHK